MDSIGIQGGIALRGKAHIQGSKNAALPVMAATLLTGEESFLENCPKISDVFFMISLLKSLGCMITWTKNGLIIDSTNVCRGELPTDAVRGMRSSLCLLGAMVGRCSEIVIEHPGGCCIGERPIDLHIGALEQMGVSFHEEGSKLTAVTHHLHGAEIRLSKPSVGATENVILAAVMAEGDTVIRNAALEPEIQTLCSYLRYCGAQIEGDGSPEILIRGGKRLYGAHFVIPADRIVAGTYLFSCIGTGGAVFLEKAPVNQMDSVLEIAERMGAKLWPSREGLYVQAQARPKFVELISTAPYPGFPTDLQSAALTVETVGDGDTMIEETIFENRFHVVSELRSMGADIEVLDSRHVRVRGVSGLRGCSVTARELRGGAALVIAGLMAQGKTTVAGGSYIFRGYENIFRDLRELGARIISV